MSSTEGWICRWIQGVESEQHMSQPLVLGNGWLMCCSPNVAAHRGTSTYCSRSPLGLYTRLPRCLLGWPLSALPKRRRSSSFSKDGVRCKPKGQRCRSQAQAHASPFGGKQRPYSGAQPRQAGNQTAGYHNPENSIESVHFPLHWFPLLSSAL